MEDNIWIFNFYCRTLVVAIMYEKKLVVLLPELLYSVKKIYSTFEAKEDVFYVPRLTSRFNVLQCI